MKRQVVERDAHGRTVWRYVDLGPALVEALRGTAVVPRTAQRELGYVSTGRKIEGGRP